MLRIVYLISMVVLGLSPIQAHSTNCPDSFKSWIHNLDRLADSVTPPLGNPEVYKVTRGPRILPVEKYQEILSFWQDCGKKADAIIAARFKNLIEHSRYMAKILEKGHSGLYISDLEYMNLFKKEAKVSKLPSEFFEEGYLPDNWKDILSECDKIKPLKKYSKTCKSIKDWLIIPFYSTINDGGGNFERLIIFVPGEFYQRFYLFSQEDGFQKEKKIVSSIILQTKDKSSGKALSSLRPVFFDKHARGHSFSQGRCLMCHPNGLREIHPLKGSYLSVKSAKNIKKFNKLVQSYAGKVNWGKEVDLKALGPSLGDTCVSCHSKEEGRNPLGVLSYPPMIMSKIHEREMPYSQLYSTYNQIIDRLNLSDNKELKLKVHKLALAGNFKQGQYYRNEEQVQMARIKVLDVLKEEGFVSTYEYYKALAIDNLLGIVKSRKSESLFKEYKRDFNQWLKGL